MSPTLTYHVADANVPPLAFSLAVSKDYTEGTGSAERREVKEKRSKHLS
jgi:hypothetical protein